MYACAVASVMCDSFWPQLYGLQPIKCFCPVVFSRQEYWNGFPCSAPGDLPNPGTELLSAFISCLAAGLFNHWATWEAPWWTYILPNKMSACSKRYVAEEYKYIYKEYMKVIRIIGGYIETISQKNLCHRSVTKRSSVLFNGSPDWARLIQGNNPV